MTSGFVNIWTEKRGDRYYTIVETGDGTRTTSQPFHTEMAANRRAEKALAVIYALHPDAEITARDQAAGAKPAKSAMEHQADSDARHEEPRA